MSSGLCYQDKWAADRLHHVISPLKIQVEGEREAVRPPGEGLRAAGERKAQKLNPCKAAHARGGDVPTGESKCWAGEITDPHYSSERPPRPSRMPSLVTSQSTFCLLTHSSHRALRRAGWATEDSVSLTITTHQNPVQLWFITHIPSILATRAWSIR